jgi:prevent-host-death family protein
MQIVTSSEARNHLSAMLDCAQHEPVMIQKQGRNAAVLLSYEAYQKLTNTAARDFDLLCERIGKNARKRGLTDKIFDEIMAENG